MDKLIIDPEFRDKIPPLTEEEFTLLEENILTDGAVFSPLIVWDNTILDGHNRYEIIQKHPELTYAVQRLPFDNRYEAISWICKHQLGRRNLTPQQKKYLIGQRYDAEKMAQGGDRKSGDAISRGQIDLLISQGSTNNATRKKIAAESGTSDSYVKRADRFAKGVDAAEEVLPGIKQEILTGAIKPTETAVAAVAKAEPEEGAYKGEEGKKPPAPSSMLFSRRAVNNTLFNKMAAKYGETKPKIEEQAHIPAPETETGRSVDALMERLHLLRH